MLGPINVTNPLNRRHPLATGLVSFWLPLSNRFGGLTLYDIAGRNHGTMTNGPTWVAGPNGFGAASLNGSNQYVDAGNTDSPVSSAITIGAWVISTDASDNAVIFNKNYDGALAVPLMLCAGGAPSGGAYNGFAFYDGTWHKSGITTDIRGDNKWHLVVGTWDGTTQSYYLDGALDASAAAGGTRGSNSQALRLGSYASDSAFFAGRISDPFLSSRCWSASEVRGFYLESRAGYPTLLNRLSRPVYADQGAAVAYCQKPMKPVRQYKSVSLARR